MYQSSAFFYLQSFDLDPRCLGRHNLFVLKDSYIPQDNALPRDLAVDNHIKLNFLELRAEPFAFEKDPFGPTLVSRLFLLVSLSYEQMTRAMQTSFNYIQLAP